MIDIRRLKVGDLVQNNGSGEAYVVVAADGSMRATAVRAVTVTNPGEWNLVGTTQRADPRTGWPR